MSEKRELRIPIQVNTRERNIIRQKAEQANMTISEYMRVSAISSSSVTVIDKSDFIINGLCGICTEIQIMKYEFPGMKENLSALDEKVVELWHLLK